MAEIYPYKHKTGKELAFPMFISAMIGIVVLLAVQDLTLSNTFINIFVFITFTALSFLIYCFFGNKNVVKVSVETHQATFWYRKVFDNKWSIQETLNLEKLKKIKFITRHLPGIGASRAAKIPYQEIQYEYFNDNPKMFGVEGWDGKSIRNVFSEINTVNPKTITVIAHRKMKRGQYIG